MPDFLTTLPEPVPDLLIVLGYFIAAWIIHRVSGAVLQRYGWANRLRRGRLRPIRNERIQTIQRVFSSLITFLVFLTAVILSVTRFVDSAGLVWGVGLFAGAFGLGLMPLVRDFATGLTFLFEDQFDVGEKVELSVPATIEGVVENVNLRTTQLRSPTGELYTVPNGEIRVVRNFSRGLFSSADVTVTLESEDLDRALAILEPLGEEALLLLPELLEPWRIVSESGHIGNHIQLKLAAKARYGTAASLRPRLLALVHKRLISAEVDLVS